MRDMPDETPPQSDEPGGPSPITLFVVAAVLVALGWFLSVKLRDLGRLQDCIAQGRTNCAPITVEKQVNPPR